VKIVHGVLTASFASLISAWPAVAHHSFAAEYDSTKKIALNGVVTKFEWTNPLASTPTILSPLWYGNSIDHWEKDTLEVDTVGFNDRFWFD
jgi:hypothetical protein